uniref:elongation factor 1-alpha C-terminal domain-related protein n=1 Tax=Enterobacter hormaechei TaxID=158836 RepID=UPI003CC504F2
LNAIGRVEVSFEEPLVLDNYQENADMGGLIFIDRLSNVTVGAGLIRETRNAPTHTTTQYDVFEVELNQLIRRHFLHWGARDLLGGK